MREALGTSPEDEQGRVIAEAKELARSFLRQRQRFVWNAPNVTFPMRQGLINLFAAYRARVRIVYLESPWPELLRRNRERTAPVPDPVLLKLADRLHVSNLTEAHQVEWVESTG